MLRARCITRDNLARGSRRPALWPTQTCLPPRTATTTTATSSKTGGWSYMWDYLNRMLAWASAAPRRRTPTTNSDRASCKPATASTTFYPNKSYSYVSTDLEAILRHHHKLRLERRYPSRDHRPKAQQRHRDRHADHALHPSRSSRQHQRRDGPERQPGAADGLLPLRRNPCLYQHIPHQREAAIHWAILELADGLGNLMQGTMTRHGAVPLEDPVFWGSQNLLIHKVSIPILRQRQSYSEERPERKVPILCCCVIRSRSGHGWAIYD